MLNFNVTFNAFLIRSDSHYILVWVKRKNSAKNSTSLLYRISTSVHLQIEVGSKKSTLLQVESK